MGVATLVGVGDLFKLTPLFQYNFEPNLMQVNIFPLNVCLVPTFEHFVPGVTAALDAGIKPTIRESVRTTGMPKRFILKV